MCRPDGIPAKQEPEFGDVKEINQRVKEKENQKAVRSSQQRISSCKTCDSDRGGTIMMIMDAATNFSKMAEASAGHSGRAAKGVNCLRPLNTLGSWVRIPLEAWISVCVYSVFVLSCVPSDGLIPVQGTLLTVYRLRNWKSGQGPAKGRRAIDRQTDR
jgi:hypothetical protein